MSGEPLDFLITLKSRVLHLRADSSSEKKMWMNVLRPFDGMAAKNKIKRDSFAVQAHGGVTLSTGATSPSASPTSAASAIAADDVIVAAMGVPDIYRSALHGCLDFLLAKGLTSQGIFRLPGQSNIIDEMYRRILAGRHRSAVQCHVFTISFLPPR